MYSFINYLFQVSVLSIVFLLLYHLAFRNQTRFHLNRSYLLSGLVLSWIIPLINIPFGIQIGTTLPQVASVLTPESISPEPILSPGNVSAEMEYGSVVDSAKPFPWWVLYWVGAALVLLRNLWVLGRIIVLRHKNKSHKVPSGRIISGSDIPAFSFFRWIFLNDKQLVSPDKDLILAHELAHSRQAHSVDLILAEIIQVFLWFNPFIVLYKKALKECHEFLADAAVLDSGVQLPIYAKSLQNEIFINRYQKLASYFRGSTLKKRMIMATKNDNRRSVWNYLLVIPLLALALMAFSYINDPIEFPSGIGEGKNDFVVLIDPAHGGDDLGSVNDSLGISEKDILLGIAKYLQKTAPKDLKIILTRESDEFVSQDDRIRMAENPDADMIIALQINSLSNYSVLGGYYTSYSPLNAYSDQSTDLVKWFNEQYLYKGNPACRPPQQAPDQILSKAECPGFMVNWGSLSSTDETKYLSDPGNQKIIAQDLHLAIGHIRENIKANFPDGMITKFEAKKKHNGFIFPIKDEEIIRIASYYSKSRIHPILKIRRPHTGIDFIALKGTNVESSDEGIVKEIKINRSRSGYGTYVSIEHNNDWETFYAHLDECLVSKGDKIKRHQIIGTVGQTGLAVSPHLHFELRKDGKAINPINFLLPVYNKMAEIKIGTTDKPAKLNVSKVAIYKFMVANDMYFNRIFEIDIVQIEKVGKKFYLIVQNRQDRNNFAYELLKNGKDLYLSKNKASYSCHHTSAEGIEAFKIENGEIIGCENRLSAIQPDDQLRK